ncbi:MAG: ABC transporter ATP-binding protein [Betaproteobacteria bacterium]
MRSLHSARAPHGVEAVQSSDADAAPALEISSLTKRYGDSVAVDGFALKVARGELVALLGPSGCGKTTTLRMIAGLAQPTSGRIVLEGRPVDNVPIHRRNIGMVFQQYALFPFLSVFENVAYGLRERRVPEPELRERVTNMLAMVGLTGLEERRPRQLSGGQQQRVALARALVINPALLLLDEPLSNLDTKLRERVRGEIRDLQRRLGITTVFVTHDQDEALSIAHVVVVMRGGRVEQVGSPLDIYQRPANAFVADFIGACNLLPAQVVAAEAGLARCELAPGLFVAIDEPALRAGERVTLAVRPERLALTAGAVASGPALTGVVRSSTYLGARTSYDVEVGSIALRCDVPDEAAPLASGCPVSLQWEPRAWIAFR